MVQFMSIIFFFFDFFNFCWVFQKFPFFCVSLYLGVPILIGGPFCNSGDHSVPPVLALLTPRNHGSSPYLSRFPFQMF